MRWWSIPIVCVLGWFLSTLTPFWALYDLARAVQAGDAAYLQSHVNFRTLRLSLSRQLAAAVQAGSRETDPKERKRVSEAATAVAFTLSESLVTPQMVVDLLDDGWPQSLDLPNAPAASKAQTGLAVPNLGRLGEFYLASEMRGFRTVVIGVPPDRPGPEQFKIRLRLRGWSWNLIEIELNETTRDRIAASIARAARSHGERKAAPPPGEGIPLRP